MSNDRLNLEVTIPAQAWEAHKRRVAFLEAALVQSMDERQQLKQWFSASALAAMRLPGMPASRNGLIQKATREDWPRRIATGRGGEQYEFHYAGLPRSAFDEIIRRVLTLPAEPFEAEEVLPVGARRASADIAPQWLLPLVRVVKSGAIDAMSIMRELPSHLPAGSALPTMADVKAAIRAYKGRPQ